MFDPDLCKRLVEQARAMGVTSGKLAIVDQLAAALEEVERLKRVEKHLRYYEVPDEAIDGLTKRLEAETEDFPTLHPIIDDTMMNLDQLRKQRDEARADITRLTHERDEARAAQKLAEMARDAWMETATAYEDAGREAVLTVFEVAKAWRDARRGTPDTPVMVATSKDLQDAIDTALATVPRDPTSGKVVPETSEDWRRVFDDAGLPHMEPPDNAPSAERKENT